jgi:DNA repair protein RadC
VRAAIPRAPDTIETMTNTTKEETQAAYAVAANKQAAYAVAANKQAEDAIIAQALEILSARQLGGPIISCAADTADYLRLRIADRNCEVFTVLFLDVRNRILAVDDLFIGSISSAHVYPREIVLKVIAYNAANVILCHNHPSGDCTPSGCDRATTKKIQTVLRAMDVTVFDHVIVSRTGHYSFADHSIL